MTSSAFRLAAIATFTVPIADAAFTKHPSSITSSASHRSAVTRARRTLPPDAAIDSAASLSFNDPPAAAAATAAAAAAIANGVCASQLGMVVATRDDMIVIEPAPRAEAVPGSMLSFAGGGSGTILFERCGLYFAGLVDGGAASVGDAVQMLGTNQSCAAPAGHTGDGWSGAFDFLGNPLDPGSEPASHAAASEPEALTRPEVFAQPVPQSARRPINAPLHTGVLAVDALTPIGKGQSMLLLGPDTLPEAAGRTALARRMLDAVAQLSPEMRTVLVLTTSPGGSRDAAAQIAELSWSPSTRVLFAETPAQAVIAAQTACSIAAAPDGDAFVVVDSLALHLEAWRYSCDVLAQRNVDVDAAEEGSQQRQFYAALTERAHRRKQGGSLTLLLSQPSASVQAAPEAAKAAFSVEDFEAAGFSQRAIGRVRMLADKGVALTPEVLTKLGIPAPGSGHPQGDGDRRSGQHLEELTSLVDGHIDLRETLATEGRVPPLDPSNSLTRIGVGSHKLRPASTSEAMRRVTRALRLELASASDPVHCEDSQRRRASAYLAVLQQPDPRPLPLGEEVALLLAASEGLLDTASDVPSEELAALLGGVSTFVAERDSELLHKISRTAFLSDEQCEALRGYLGEYFGARIAPA